MKKNIGKKEKQSSEEALKEFLIKSIPLLNKTLRDTRIKYPSLFAHNPPKKIKEGGRERVEELIDILIEVNSNPMANLRYWANKIESYYTKELKRERGLTRKETIAEINELIGEGIDARLLQKKLKKL